MDPLALDAFEHIVFFTGAGLSSESGIPTYRGAGGVWAEYDYGTYACQRAFDRDPAKVWEFHNARRLRMVAADPSDAHVMIARAQARHPAVSIVTQNIDGLHQRAGATDVIELHGSLWRVRCDHCGSHKTDRSAPLENVTCGCGHHYRPDIVWFGDGLVGSQPVDG